MQEESMGLKREKYWKELTQEEKIERQRLMIKSLQTELRNLSNRFYDFEVAYEQHSHQDDKIVIPYSRNMYNRPTTLMGGVTTNLLDGRGADEVYF